MKTILIVEDIDLNIDLLTQLLEDDFSLLVAKNGIEGVEAAEGQNPDLILMDISLPVMDGYEAVSLIRKSNQEIPIIGLSANAMQGDIQKALEAGFSDYLTKPINEDLLFQKIRLFLG